MNVAAWPPQMYAWFVPAGMCVAIGVALLIIGLVGRRNPPPPLDWASGPYDGSPMDPAVMSYARPGASIAGGAVMIVMGCILAFTFAHFEPTEFWISRGLAAGLGSAAVLACVCAAGSVVPLWLMATRRMTVTTGRVLAVLTSAVTTALCVWLAVILIAAPQPVAFGS